MDSMASSSTMIVGRFPKDSGKWPALLLGHKGKKMHSVLMRGGFLRKEERT